MNTTYLQQLGFGILAYQTDNQGYATANANREIPNYMWNQQVFYNTTAAGWYYAPLKYWPNETKKDSQTIPTSPAGMPDQTSPANIDKLSFFAYAPWVNAVGSTGRALWTDKATETNQENLVGIGYLTNNEGKLSKYLKDGSDTYFNVEDPYVYYTVARNPNYSVDLLWGVAPAGGLKYTDVSGTPVSINEGLPLVNLTKPAINTNMKFMFQHALARLGVKVVAAVDQVAAGGVFDYGNSKITIEDIRIKGHFAERGILNLNNTTANQALWSDQVWCDEDAKALHIDATAATNSLAPHLRYDATKNPVSGTKTQQDVTGVTTELSDAIKVSSILDSYYHNYSKVVNDPGYSATTPYFANWTDNSTDTYAPYSIWGKDGSKYYLHKYHNDKVYGSSDAYTDITDVIAVTYPTATFWENIYSIPKAWVNAVTEDGEFSKVNCKSWTAYRKVGNTYTPTGAVPEVGDYVFAFGGTERAPEVEAKPSNPAGTKKYVAVPNYFMIIPCQALGTSLDKEDRTLRVKITYYVSTTDEKLKDRIVYTKNEVEKDVVLPHLKNGVAYNLKLILGLTSVKVEAEVADWVTTDAVVNLPQNTSE
jgi:hypothetical protein